MKTVSILVSKCGRHGHIYDRVSEETLSDVEEALAAADGKREDGISVIVRPNYNESDEKCSFFREWRSANGEPFREVRFNIDYPVGRKNA